MSLVPPGYNHGASVVTHGTQPFVDPFVVLFLLGKKSLLSPIYVNRSSISSHCQSVLGFNGAFAVRARVEGLRDFGACQNPFGAFLLLQVNDAGALSQGF